MQMSCCNLFANEKQLSAEFVFQWYVDVDPTWGPERKWFEGREVPDGLEGRSIQGVIGAGLFDSQLNDGSICQNGERDDDLPLFLA